MEQHASGILACSALIGPAHVMACERVSGSWFCALAWPVVGPTPSRPCLFPRPVRASSISRFAHLNVRIPSFCVHILVDLAVLFPAVFCLLFEGSIWSWAMLVQVFVHEAPQYSVCTKKPCFTIRKSGSYLRYCSIVGVLGFIVCI